MSQSPGRRRRRALQGINSSALAMLALLPGAALVAPVHAAAAQQPAAATGRVAGTVVNEGGQPIGDVQVFATTPAGGRVGAVTNAQGRYTINGVAAGTAAVRAQRIGFQARTQTVTVTAGTVATADFQLAVAPTTLTEVRVQAGYTNEARRDVSGAVATVSANETRDQKVATVEEALRGRVPGVQIQSTGQPGRPAAINIRGQSSLGSTSPLYVVDGMYLGTQNPNINPDDIATFNILKDASAAAQYGSQAANGVVVITTRRGQAGQNQFALSSYAGLQTTPKTLNMAGADEFKRVFLTAYTNAGITPPAGITSPTTVNTDWQDAVLQTGRIQNYNLQASGGTTSASYLVSGSIFDQKGTIITTNFRRYSVRVNSQAARGRFQIGENIALSQGRQTAFPNGTFGAANNYPLIEAVGLPPIIPIRDSTNPGGYGFGSAAVPTFAQNPVAAAQSYYNKFNANNVIGSAFANVNIVKGLSYRLNLGINYADSSVRNWNSTTQIRYTTPIINGGFLNQARPNYTNLLYENLLTYDGTLGREGVHRISAVAGQTSQNNTYQYLSAYRQGYSDQNLQQISGGSTAGASNNGYTVPLRTNSLLSRVTYSYNNRYLLTGSVRRDCSSRFSPADKCGVFGAGSLGYVVSEEQFFKGLPLIGGADFFKLRGSLGVLGDQNINDFGYIGLITLNRNYNFGGAVQSGATLETLTNPNLKWQRNRSADVGFDLGLLNNALSVTADYYRNTADQLLVNIPLPPSLGSLNGSPFAEYQPLNPAVNAGRVRNAGFELGITHRMGQTANAAGVASGSAPSAPNGFSMNTTFTLTTNANRVLSLGNGGQPINVDVARTQVGQPIASFYVRRTCGIFPDAASVQAHASNVNGVTRVIQPNAQPGDVCYSDLNGDGQITDADRYNAGNGTPKVTSGLFFEPRYGAFDFGLNFRGAFGFKNYNYIKLNTENTSGLGNVRSGLNYWSPTNTNADQPRPVFGAAGAENFNGLSDRYVEKGTFVKIQNIVLGYTLPPGALRQLRLSGASTPRVYVNVQNVATFTNYSGFDPEILGFGNPLARGLDYGLVYPNPRTYTVGFDLRF